MHIGNYSTIIKLGDVMRKLKNPHILLIGLVLGTIIISSNVYAGNCFLGDRVTRDLYGALKIIRIVAPLLVITFSTVDAIKALTKGDGGAELKGVAKRFGKRAIYAAILFFLPMLIDLFMQMADVWDANGNCLQDVENGGSHNTSLSCSNYHDSESCNRNENCHWGSTNNVCLPTVR